MALEWVNKAGFLTVYLVVFLDMLGFGVMIPAIRDLTTALVKNSGLSWPSPEIFMGFLMAAYSGAQMISAPILGRLSDVYGRKPVFLVSAIGNLLSYIVWILSSSYWPFLLGRLLSGITGGNIAIAQSILADNTSPEQRPRAMGLLGACIGMGFVLGPFIGAFMININHKIMININPFWQIGMVPLILALVSVIMIVVNHFGQVHESAEKGGVLAGLLSIAQPPQNSTYATQLLSQLSFVSFEVLFAWILQRQYGFNLKETYYFFGFQGVLLALVQGGIYRRVEKRRPPADWVKLGLLGSALGMMILPWIGNLTLGQLFGIAGKTVLLSILLIIMTLSLGFGTPSLNAFASLNAPKNEQGQTMGNMQGLAALARFVAPVVATSLYAVWLPLPFLLGGLLCLAAWLVFSRVRST
ncbi:MAG: tetracycline resistance MFS efflux pump [Turneriella sp.]